MTAAARLRRLEREPKLASTASGGRGSANGGGIENALTDIARRVRRLGWLASRRGMEAAAVEREEIAEALLLLANPALHSVHSPLPTWWRAPTAALAAGGDDQAVRRLRALVAHQVAEIERLNRTLSSSARPRPRRRRGVDSRQTALAL